MYIINYMTLTANLISHFLILAPPCQHLWILLETTFSSILMYVLETRNNNLDILSTENIVLASVHHKP